MKASYTLTLPTDQSECSRNQVVEVRSFARDCGHRHRTPRAAAKCKIVGQPSGSPRLQVVAYDAKNAPPRALNEDEQYEADGRPGLVICHLEPPV